MSGTFRRSITDDILGDEGTSSVSWPQGQFAQVASERSEIERFECLLLSALDLETGVYADQDTSSSRLAFDTRRARLEGVIKDMLKVAPSWDGSETKVSPESALTALKFIGSLPSNRRLPQVAPDGEGDIMFVWQPPNGDCIVTVQDKLIHLVNAPGSPDVEHVDAQRFLGEHIPVLVLQYIPAK